MKTPEAPIKAVVAEPRVKLVAVQEIKLPTAVLAIDADPNGKRLFAACLDGGIYEVIVETGVHKQIGKHDSYASGVHFLPRLEQIVSAGYDGKMQWHDANDGNSIRTIDAHKFWSWKMRVSPNESLVASVTGQYKVGGYKYEPASEAEPSVKVFDAASGNLRWSLNHVPPVLSVAFSPGSKHLAAGNMMGEVRIWNLETGKQVASWTTPDFTSWGIIKSHHYIGGIFDLVFSPDGSEVLVCGMGPMVDPMAGNGKQTWQRFAWMETPVRKAAEIHETDSGHGLMETVGYHPDQKYLLMAGRLAQGKWSAALFDSASGALLHSIDTKMRTTSSVWLDQGKQLALGGATTQEKKKDGRCPDFGHIKLFQVQNPTA